MAHLEIGLCTFATHLPISMWAMKSSSVCAPPEPEKITKTKWAQYYGTPCIYLSDKYLSVQTGPFYQLDFISQFGWFDFKQNIHNSSFDSLMCTTNTGTETMTEDICQIDSKYLSIRSLWISSYELSQELEVLISILRHLCS